MLNVVWFVLGWLVCLFGQMQNSIVSSSNGLTNDLAGMKKWLRLQSGALLWRAFFSAVLYPALVQWAINKVSPPLQAVGLSIAVWGFAGIAGFSACGALHQLLGLIPALRGVEIPDAVPPPADPPKENQT